MGANVSVSGWTACINAVDGTLVVSCTVEGEGITSVGMVVNTAEGRTLATAYTGLSEGCVSVSPSLNLVADGIVEGDTIILAADGEAGGDHFFFEESISVAKCDG